jgi:hypothetical protein
MKYTVHSIHPDGPAALEYSGPSWQEAGTAVMTARNEGAEMVIIRFTGTISEAAAPARAETPAANPVPKPGAFCDIHQVMMERRERDGDHWYSHKTDQGDWCRGSRPAQRQRAKSRY